MPPDLDYSSGNVSQSQYLQHTLLISDNTVDTCTHHSTDISDNGNLDVQCHMFTCASSLSGHDLLLCPKRYDPSVTGKWVENGSLVHEVGHKHVR